MLPFAGILLVMNTAQTGVGSVLIPNRIAELAPAAKTTVFGLVMEYLAVDQALMTLVLPRAGDSGRDLGLLNIAQAGAQALAPVAAAVVIAFGGYPAVYLLAVVAALVVLPIRSVR